MNAFEVYKDYVALRRHFDDEKYDYIRYQGNVNVNVETFEKRKDKYHFVKLARHKDPHNFLLANIAANPKAWIGDIARNGEQVYMDWAQRQQALSYVYKSELSALHQDFDENFRAGPTHPYVLTLYIGDVISLETITILCKLTNCLARWDRKYANDPAYKFHAMRIRKYMPFITFETDKIRKITIDYFQQ